MYQLYKRLFSVLCFLFLVSIPFDVFASDGGVPALFDADMDVEVSSISEDGDSVLFINNSIVVGVYDSQMLDDGSYSSEAAERAASLVGGEVVGSIGGGSFYDIRVRQCTHDELNGLCDVILGSLIEGVGFAMPDLVVGEVYNDDQVSPVVQKSPIWGGSWGWESHINLSEARDLMGDSVGAPVVICDNGFDYTHTCVKHLDSITELRKLSTLSALDSDWTSICDSYTFYCGINGLEPQFDVNASYGSPDRNNIRHYMANLPGEYKIPWGEQKGIHGTHVAGIVGAAHCETIGGVTPIGTKIYGWDFDNISGVSLQRFSRLLSPLNLVGEKDCKVINFSCSFSLPDKNGEAWTEEQKRAYYDESRVAACAKMMLLLDSGYDFVVGQAAGNDGNDVSMQSGLFTSIRPEHVREALSKHRPPEVGLPVTEKDVSEWFHRIRSRILVVGNASYYSDGEYKLHSTSCYGPDVDICAPGMGIMSTTIDNSHMTMSGTSMSTPMVSGTVSLVWGKYPNLTGEQVCDAITGSASQEVLPYHEEDDGTYYLLDCEAALKYAGQMDSGVSDVDMADSYSWQTGSGGWMSTMGVRRDADGLFGEQGFSVEYVVRPVFSPEAVRSYAYGRFYPAFLQGDGSYLLQMQPLKDWVCPNCGEAHDGFLAMDCYRYTDAIMEDGISYTWEEPRGILGVDRFTLYRKGSLVSDIPEAIGVHLDAMGSHVSVLCSDVLYALRGGTDLPYVYVGNR